MNTVTRLRRQRQQSTYKLLMRCLLVLRLFLAIPHSPGHVRGSLHRQRVLLTEMQARMTQEQWIRSFRMRLQDVQALYAKMAERLQRNAIKACNSSGSPIEPECRVLMVLRWCAGGSYLDCMALYGVSKAAFFENLWIVLECIADAVPVVFRMDRESCQSRADGFRLKQ